jgi:hypothetical protein
VGIDASKLSPGEGSAAPSVKQSGDGEVIFMGKKSLAFGLQLYELIYDNFRNQLKFTKVTRYLALRVYRESDDAASTHTVIEPALIGDPNEGDAFIAIDYSNSTFKLRATHSASK